MPLHVCDEVEIGWGGLRVSATPRPPERNWQAWRGIVSERLLNNAWPQSSWAL